MTREEELWAAIIAALNGDDVYVPVPAWRREEFLVGILGAIKGVEGATVPEPVWREEQYLKAMFDAISEGGGGSSYKLLKSAEFNVNTTSTSQIEVGTVAAGSDAYDSNKIIYVRVFDKAGVRAGYWTGSDNWIINNIQYKGGTTDISFVARIINVNGAINAGAIGVYASSVVAMISCRGGVSHNVSFLFLPW